MSRPKAHLAGSCSAVHVLRHTYASLTPEAGEPVPTVARWLPGCWGGRGVGRPVETPRLRGGCLARGG
ncbi:hypothetical protein PV379_29535 [Streptomyces caniscabiei]|uniref:hypothetical protein n=1 Tax=Streptomyces caniscabiei TaxID=2746961 RepID=UPI0029BD8D54|nr:hypothetical protein [Streptomyces caniscabiei]MDX2781413.1 hypothetical protein [Streptomyces caniscabiei]